MAALCADAQGSCPLRDSLSAAIQQLSLRPDSIDLRLKKAAWNIQLEEWENAKEEYDRILRREPQNLAALYYRAYCNDKLGRYNFARADYESLLQLVPDNFETKLGLALLNDKDHRKTEALDQMNIMVEQYPDSAVVYAVRGGMEKDRQMLDLAIYDYSEAIRIEPQNTDYLLSRADLCLMTNKKREAKRDLDTLVALGVSRAALAEFYKRLQ